MPPARAQFFVTCMLVMGCADVERCRLAERILIRQGFHSRSAVEGTASCSRSLEREYPAGNAGELLNAACREIELALVPNVADWKAFVQVVGRESMWATLEAGKPTLRGILAGPRRPRL